MFLSSLSGKKITSFLRHIMSSVDSPALPYGPHYLTNSTISGGGILNINCVLTLLKISV